MNFVHPGLLAGLGLAAIPLIIYLLNRRKYRIVRWAAMEFLLNAIKKNHRRLLLENLLLLLLRTLAVACLALGLARPEGAGLLPGSARSQRNVVFLLDTSYSMGLRAGATTLLERAKELVADTVDRQLREGDRLLLEAFDEEARLLMPDPVYMDGETSNRVRAELAELSVGVRGTRLAPALQKLLNTLDRFDRREGGAPAHVPVEAYVLTDLQRLAVADDQGLIDRSLPEVVKTLAARGVRLVLVDVGVSDPVNAVVASVRPSEELVGTGAPVRYDVRVQNQSTVPMTDLVVAFFADGERREEKRIELAPMENKLVSFYHSFFNPGFHHVEAQLSTDSLAVDNRASTVLHVRDKVEVLLVDGEDSPVPWEGETDFLEAVLQPDTEAGQAGQLRSVTVPQVVNETYLTESLDSFQVVVLANVGALADDQVERVEEYVRNGGALILFLGDQIDSTFYNTKLWKDGKGLLPARLERVMEAAPDEPFRLDQPDLLHPALSYFADPKLRSDLTTAHVRRFVQVTGHDAGLRRSSGGGEGGEFPAGEGAEAAPAGDVKVLLRYAIPEASPAVLERPYGRGHVVMFTTTADAEWSNFTVHFLYPVVVQRMVHHLAGLSDEGRNQLAGEPFELLLPAAGYATEIDLISPDGQKVPKRLVLAPGEEDRFLLTHADTGTPGVYSLQFRIQGGESRTEYFAVNVDTREGDLLKIDEQELSDLVPGMRPKLIGWEDARGELLGAEDARSKAQEYWPWLIAGVILLLVSESILACRFGRL